MQYFESDQFDTATHWEAGEHFAICRQQIGARGSEAGTLDQFLEQTKSWNVFSHENWPASTAALQPAYVKSHPNFCTVVSLCEKFRITDVLSHQEFFVLFEEPLLLDVAWSDMDTRYFNRAFWTSTA